MEWTVLSKSVAVFLKPAGARVARAYAKNFAVRNFVSSCPGRSFCPGRVFGSGCFACLVPSRCTKPCPLPCDGSGLLRTAFLQGEWGDAECGLSVFTKSMLSAYGKTGPSWCVCLRKPYFAAERNGSSPGNGKGRSSPIIYSVWSGDRSVYERSCRCRRCAAGFGDDSPWHFVMATCNEKSGSIKSCRSFSLWVCSVLPESFAPGLFVRRRRNAADETGIFVECLA